MDIIAGKARVTVNSIVAESRYFQGKTYPALKVRFDGGVPDEVLEALKGNDWHLVNMENGTDVELSVQESYSIIETHEVIFLKADRTEAENLKLKEEIARIGAVIPQLLSGKNDDTLVELIDYIPDWTQRAYVVGDVRKYGGQLKRCCSTHDSTGNPTWTPAVASLWSPYHAKSAEYAFPWVVPTGAHDVYMVNEYMEFTDGIIYKCLLNTNYSPVENAKAWQAVK